MQRVQLPATWEQARDSLRQQAGLHESLGNFCLGLLFVLRVVQLVLALFAGIATIVVNKGGTISGPWAYWLGAVTLTVAVLRGIDMIPIKSRADMHCDAMRELDNFANSLTAAVWAGNDGKDKYVALMYPGQRVPPTLKCLSCCGCFCNLLAEASAYLEGCFSVRMPQAAGGELPPAGNV
jgi:hypothetical protein